MTLADVAVELYALPPAEFTAARNARAKQVRADGDRELAGRVQALRKPTLAAWAVDLLVRERPEQVEALLGLGARLLEAQTARDGDRLRELAREQHAAMAALREAARGLAADAGHRLGDAVDVPLDSTLRAAMTDPDAAAAVRSGLLVADLVSTGFGPVEVGDAVAVPDAPPLTSPAAAPARPTDDDGDAPVTLPRRRTSAGTGTAPGRAAPEPEVSLPGPRAAPRPPATRRPASARRSAAEPATAPDARTGPTTEPASTGARATDDDRAAARRAKQERDAAARAEAHRRERERAERDLTAAQDRVAEADRELAEAEAAVGAAVERRTGLDAEVERLAARLAETRDLRDAAVREERHAETVREAAARAAGTTARRARAARDRLDRLG